MPSPDLLKGITDLLKANDLLILQRLELGNLSFRHTIDHVSQ